MTNSDNTTSNSDENKKPWSQEQWFGPWQFEIGANGTAGFGGLGGIYGGGLSISLRHRSEYDNRPLVRLSEDFGVVLAILSAGITAAPRGMWMGNEWGFSLRARFLESYRRNARPEQRLALGIAPSFRITRPDSRLRFPSFLPSFVPEIGVGLERGRAPEFLLQFHPFSMGFLVTDHVAIELEPTMMLAVPTDKRPVDFWALEAVSVQLR